VLQRNNGKSAVDYTKIAQQIQPQSSAKMRGMSDMSGALK